MFGFAEYPENWKYQISMFYSAVEYVFVFCRRKSLSFSSSEFFVYVISDFVQRWLTHRQPLHAPTVTFINRHAYRPWRPPKDEAGTKDEARPPDGDSAMEVEPPAGSKGTPLTTQAALAGETVKPVSPVEVVVGGGRGRGGSLSGRSFILEVTKTKHNRKGRGIRGRQLRNARCSRNIKGIAFVRVCVELYVYMCVRVCVCVCYILWFRCFRTECINTF